MPPGLCEFKMLRMKRGAQNASEIGKCQPPPAPPDPPPHAVGVGVRHCTEFPAGPTEVQFTVSQSPTAKYCLYPCQCITAHTSSGEQRRAFGCNNVHEHASRSHVVFQLILESQEKGQTQVCACVRVCLRRGRRSEACKCRGRAPFLLNRSVMG